MQNKRKMPRHVNVINVAGHLETDKRSIAQNIRLSLKELFNFHHEPLDEEQQGFLIGTGLCILMFITAYALTAFNDFLYWKGL